MAKKTKQQILKSNLTFFSLQSPTTDQSSSLNTWPLPSVTGSYCTFLQSKPSAYYSMADQ